MDLGRPSAARLFQRIKGRRAKPKLRERHLKLSTFYSWKNGYDPAHFYIYLSLGNDKKKKKKNHEEGAASQLVALVTLFPNIEKE